MLGFWEVSFLLGCRCRALCWTKALLLHYMHNVVGSCLYALCNVFCDGYIDGVVEVTIELQSEGLLVESQC